MAEQPEKNPEPKYVGDVGFMPQNPTENIKAAKMLKAEGTKWLQEGNLQNAQKCYIMMLSNLKHLDKEGQASANPMAGMGGGNQKEEKTTPEQDAEVLSLFIAMNNNRAVCHKKEADAADALAKTAAKAFEDAKAAGVEAAELAVLEEKVEKLKRTVIRRYNDVVKTTSEVIKKEDANSKARLRRATAHAMLKDVDSARADLEFCSEKERKGMEARLAKLDEQNDKRQARMMKRMLGGGASEDAAPAEEAAAVEENEEGVRGSSTHVDLTNLKDSGSGDLTAEEFAALRAKTKSAAEVAKNLTPEQQAEYGCKQGVAASAVRPDSDDSDDDGADFAMGSEGQGALLGDY